VSLVIRERPPLRLSFHTDGYRWAGGRARSEQRPGRHLITTTMSPGVLSGMCEAFLALKVLSRMGVSCG
jgi:hypothetical protein